LGTTQRLQGPVHVCELATPSLAGNMSGAARRKDNNTKSDLVDMCWFVPVIVEFVSLVIW
jgi:hypothetical protein